MTKQNPLLAGWEHIRKRPLMYFSNDVPAVVNFLEGFKTACLVLNPAFDYETIYQQVIREHGLEDSSQAIWRQLQERGLSDEEVISEMLAIHQEIWAQLDFEAVYNKMNTKA